MVRSAPSGSSTGRRSTLPRGASMRPTRTVTGSPSLIAPPLRVPTSIVACSLSSHQSSRSRRTGRRPSYWSPSPKATNAPAPISPTISSSKAPSRSPDSNSSRSSRKQRATSSASRSIVIASRSRLEVHGAALATHEASGVGSPAIALEQRPMADEVRVASDRRGEMAVVGQRQPRVAAVARVVVGLLERPQHQAGQCAAAPAGPSRPSRPPSPTPPPPRRRPAVG